MKTSRHEGRQTMSWILATSTSCADQLRSNLERFRNATSDTCPNGFTGTVECEALPCLRREDSRLFGESWDSTNLYWARLADEMGYSPVMLNRWFLN